MKFLKHVTIFAAVFILAAVFAGTAMAEEDYDPQYKGKGHIGSEGKEWRVIHTNDLEIERRIVTPEEAYVTPYGTQWLPRIVTVNNFTQLTTLSGTSESTSGGASVYQVDLTAGNVFRFDLGAIHDSIDASAGATVFRDNAGGIGSGLTVISPTPTADNNGAVFEIAKWDTGTSPLTLSVPVTGGVSPVGTIGRTYHTTANDNGTGGVSVWAIDTSAVTDAPLNAQYEQQAYQLNHNSAVSITPKWSFIPGLKEVVP